MSHLFLMSFSLLKTVFAILETNFNNLYSRDIMLYNPSLDSN